MQCVSSRDVPDLWRLCFLCGGDLFALGLHQVQGLPPGFVLARQRDGLPGVPAGPDQRRECERGVQRVPPRDVLGFRWRERVHEMRYRVRECAHGELELHAVPGRDVRRLWGEPVQPVRRGDMGGREHREHGGVRRVRDGGVLDHAWGVKPGGVHRVPRWQVLQRDESA